MNQVCGRDRSRIGGIGIRIRLTELVYQIGFITLFRSKGREIFLAASSKQASSKQAASRQQAAASSN